MKHVLMAISFAAIAAAADGAKVTPLMAKGLGFAGKEVPMGTHNRPIRRKGTPATWH